MAAARPFPPVYRAIAQGAFWGVGVSIALIAWARATSDVVRIPPVHLPWFGLVLSLAGAALLLSGVAQRWRPGGTSNLAHGVSRLLPHPVYTGFCILCPGVSIALGSASGLWLISPLVALICVALVLGNERHNLREGQLLPGHGTGPPTGSDRLSFYLFVLLPWLALYEIVLAIGMPPDAISGVSRLEQRLPVLEWSQIIYASTYILTVIAPLFAKTRNDLRSYSVSALWTMLLAYPAFLLIPLIAPKRPFTAHTIPGRLLLWERTLDSPVAAFPSFHVIWAMLAAEVFARRWPRLKALFYGWAILVALSCVTTSQHSILDVLGGAATVALVVHRQRVWAAFRLRAERFANSRHEWRIGPVRIVNHAVYAGLAAFLGLWVAETMAGPGAQTDLLTLAGAVTLVAALRFRFADGNLRLLKPIGICGSLLGAFLLSGFSGGAAGALFRPLSAPGGWLVASALCLGVASAQTIASLHCRTGLHLHATSICSLCCTGATALILTRLWILAAPLHLIAGLYFILAGLAKFVEESWREESSAHEWRRAQLPRPQSLAIAGVISGILITSLGRSTPAPVPHFVWNAILPAIVFSLTFALATGAHFEGPPDGRNER